LSEAFRQRDRLDGTDRACLAQWLVAACLPDAVLDVAPVDLTADECIDVLPALVQYARAAALFQRESLSDRTVAAFPPLLGPGPTVAHLQGLAGWGYLLSRHATDDCDAEGHLIAAAALLDKLEPSLAPFHHAMWRSRLLIREVMRAERNSDLAGAWGLL